MELPHSTKIWHGSQYDETKKSQAFLLRATQSNIEIIGLAGSAHTECVLGQLHRLRGLGLNRWVACR